MYDPTTRPPGGNKRKATYFKLLSRGYYPTSSSTIPSFAYNYFTPKSGPRLPVLDVGDAVWIPAWAFILWSRNKHNEAALLRELREFRGNHEKIVALLTSYIIKHKSIENTLETAIRACLKAAR